MLDKRRRQLTLRSVLTHRGFRSQAVLVQHLEAWGHRVHRTTVGQDLRDIGATYRRPPGDPLPAWHIPLEVEERRLARDAAMLDEVLAESAVSAAACGDRYVLVRTLFGESDRVADAILASEFTYEDVAHAGPVTEVLVLVQVDGQTARSDPARAAWVAERIDAAAGATAPLVQEPVLQAAG